MCRVCIAQTIECMDQDANTISDGQAGAGQRLGGGVGARVHLASRSPRRRELLDGAGIEHVASHPGVDDGQLAPGNVSPESWVMALAYLKASTAARTAKDQSLGGRVVLGADTIVVHHGAMMGQPTDAADVRRMIVAMRDDVHDVVTGVALLDPVTGRRELFVDRAVVRVGHVSDSEIDAYVASAQWRGKAGAYNLSERIAAGWPIEYDGDPGTIMGLPMRKLTGRLAAFVAAG
jgi:septum formation protein